MQIVSQPSGTAPRGPGWVWQVFPDGPFGGTRFAAFCGTHNLTRVVNPCHQALYGWSVKIPRFQIWQMAPDVLFCSSQQGEKKPSDLLTVEHQLQAQIHKHSFAECIL